MSKQVTSLIRKDLDELMTGEESVKLSDLSFMSEHVGTGESLVNWCHTDIVDMIPSAVNSCYSKFRINHHGELVRKSKFSYLVPEPRITGLIRQDVNQLHDDDGHISLIEYDVIELLRVKTDNNETLLNWYNSAYVQNLNKAIDSHYCSYKLAHGVLISKAKFALSSAIQGRNGFDIRQARAIYKRYSKRLNQSESISFL
jgi:hypothetical protein